MTDCEDDVRSSFLPFSLSLCAMHRTQDVCISRTRLVRSVGRSSESLTRNAQRCIAYQFLSVSVAFHMIMIIIIIIIIILV
jgi:hypothetical protein